MSTSRLSAWSVSRQKAHSLMGGGKTLVGNRCQDESRCGSHFAGLPWPERQSNHGETSVPTHNSSPPTSPTLLQSLRQPGDTAAWDWFARLYTPLLFSWARHAGLQE